jgi:hypothetical protein
MDLVRLKSFIVEEIETAKYQEDLYISMWTNPSTC